MFIFFSLSSFSLPSNASDVKTKKKKDNKERKITQSHTLYMHCLLDRYLFPLSQLSRRASSHTQPKAARAYYFLGDSKKNRLSLEFLIGPGVMCFMIFCWLVGLIIGSPKTKKKHQGAAPRAPLYIIPRGDTNTHTHRVKVKHDKEHFAWRKKEEKCRNMSTSNSKRRRTKNEENPKPGKWVPVLLDGMGALLPRWACRDCSL